MKKKKNPHMGSSFESFLEEEGIFEEIKARVLKHIKKVRKTKRKKSNG